MLMMNSLLEFAPLGEMRQDGVRACRSVLSDGPTSTPRQCLLCTGEQAGGGGRGRGEREGGRGLSHRNFGNAAREFLMRF